jgi:hypothetical protein
MAVERVRHRSRALACGDCALGRDWSAPQLNAELFVILLRKMMRHRSKPAQLLAR